MISIACRSDGATKTSDWAPQPDLSKVDEVGFTDLMPWAAADVRPTSAGSKSTERRCPDRLPGNPRAPRKNKIFNGT
jgi:hypothetical protein